MIRKFFLLLTVVCSCLAVSAQHAPGSWKVFPMSGEFFDDVVDTPDKVYFITGGSLYSYDKEYQETVYYAPGSRITDSGIASIHYNDAGKYLCLIYDNSNIDLIYDDGRVVNMPEIKDASLTVSKKVNDVAFRNDHIYLATDFGLVIYDDRSHVVTESAMLPVKLTKIMANKDYLFTIINYKFSYSPIGERHNSLDKFKPLCSVSMEAVQQIDENNFLFINGTGAGAILYKLTSSAPQTAAFSKVTEVPGIKNFDRYRQGFLVQCDKGLVLLDDKGAISSTVVLPDILASQLVATYTGTDRLWAADNDGIASYRLDSDGGVTMLSDKFRPESSQQFGAGFVTPTADGTGVYVTHIGMSEYHPGGDAGWSQHLPFICERYDWADGTFTPMHPYGVRNTSRESCAEADVRGSKYFYGGPGNTLVDPVDPDLLYHSNNFEGLILIKDRKVLREINSTLIPIPNTWNSRVECAEFDQMGNLWIGVWAQANNTPFAVLPKAAVDRMRKDPASISRSDFVVAPWPGNDQGKCDMRLLAIPGTTKMFYVCGGYNDQTIGYDNKGTASFSDDTYVKYTGYVDQDGTVSTPLFRTAVTIDHNGHIWLGTTSGIFVIRDINQLGEPSTGDLLKVVRPKVSRNDGTNYADYLLATETILNIAVDPSNRKWIATQASGVYLVSADGTEIIDHYTVDNSPLMSNTVYTVACDPAGNDVLLGTPQGMFLYSSTSTAAADNYSEVYAFPNPVRPDYTGWITINGLMDNSLVKIADMQGNVFWEGRSEGGMVVWDGCNRDGSRVRSGVYLVFASQNASGDASGAVTKIVVIN